MKGRTYIDGVDLSVDFKTIITSGGYNGLISPAQFKTIDFNDWSEEDGIEPDLDNPVLDTKEFDLTFGCIDNSKTEDFIAMLSEGVYHHFEFKEIEAERKLRLISQPNKETIQQAELFTLRFADDFPFHGYSFLAPINPAIQSGYEIDNIPLSNYGVLVLEGTDDEIIKIPAVKANLLTSNKNRGGVAYDDKWVRFQQKNVAMKCCLRANSINTFWRNYNALIYTLTRPNERQLYVEKFHDSFSCFYKSCPVTLFTIIGSEVWCEFTLNLTFTNFRPKKSYYVWGSQNGRVIMTEDKINAIIR